MLCNNCIYTRRIVVQQKWQILQMRRLLQSSPFYEEQAQAKAQATQISLGASTDYAHVISRTGVPEVSHHICMHP